MFWRDGRVRAVGRDLQIRDLFAPEDQQCAATSKTMQPCPAPTRPAHAEVSLAWAGGRATVAGVPGSGCAAGRKDRLPQTVCPREGLGSGPGGGGPVAQALMQAPHGKRPPAYQDDGGYQVQCDRHKHVPYLHGWLRLARTLGGPDQGTVKQEQGPGEYVNM